MFIDLYKNLFTLNEIEDGKTLIRKMPGEYFINKDHIITISKIYGKDFIDENKNIVPIKSRITMEDSTIYSTELAENIVSFMFINKKNLEEN